MVTWSTIAASRNWQRTPHLTVDGMFCNPGGRSAAEGLTADDMRRHAGRTRHEPVEFVQMMQTRGGRPPVPFASRSDSRAMRTTPPGSWRSSRNLRDQTRHTLGEVSSTSRELSRHPRRLLTNADGNSVHH